MGKKAKFKIIRKMANNMSILNTIKRTGVIMTGQQILDEGGKEINGEEVLPTNIYRGMKKDPTPMNHEKNMKHLYYKHGNQGVKAYVQNVHNHAKPKTSI